MALGAREKIIVTNGYLVKTKLILVSHLIIDPSMLAEIDRLGRSFHNTNSLFVLSKIHSSMMVDYHHLHKFCPESLGSRDDLICIPLMMMGRSRIHSTLIC